MQSGEISRGKKNWLKLKTIIQTKQLPLQTQAKKFQLFQKQTGRQKNQLKTIYRYKQHQFIQISPQPQFSELLQFNKEIDATGKWVWQAQQIAAFYIIHHFQKYIQNWIKRKKNDPVLTFKVLELGAGCSGLAVITFAKIFLKYYKQKELQLLLTDGLEENIEFLNINLIENNLKNQEFQAKMMKWGQSKKSKQSFNEVESKENFDLIIVCDCLFFCEYHKNLISSIQSNLSEHGKALLVNPSRGDSMDKFIQLTKTTNLTYQFKEFKEQSYQLQLNKLKQSKDLNKENDLPHFIQLTKRKTN